MVQRIYWAIAYTKRGGKTVRDPYIFTDTIRWLKKDAWAAMMGNEYARTNRELLRKVCGMKAIKIRIRVLVV